MGRTWSRPDSSAATVSALRRLRYSMGLPLRAMNTKSSSLDQRAFIRAARPRKRSSAGTTALVRSAESVFIARRVVPAVAIWAEKATRFAVAPTSAQRSPSASRARQSVQASNAIRAAWLGVRFSATTTSASN